MKTANLADGTRKNTNGLDILARHSIASRM